MRDAKNRQLIALTIGLLLAHPLVALAAGPTPGGERLQALKLMETALAASDAGGDEWKKLSAAYDDLVAADPGSADALSARGEFRWERGDHAPAVEDWQAALRIDLRQAGALSGLAGAALAAGDAPQAAALYRQAVSAQPQYAPAHFALANVLFLFRHELRDDTHPNEASLVGDALRHFAAAARLVPADIGYARAYAETFYSLPQPDWEQARQAWEAVRDLSPAKDFALVNLARIHLRMGHFDTAKECLRQVQNPAFQRIKDRLEAQLTTPSARSEAPIPLPP